MLCLLNHLIATKTKQTLNKCDLQRYVQQNGYYSRTLLVSFRTEVAVKLLLDNICIFYICRFACTHGWVYGCRYRPNRTGQERMVEEIDWKRHKFFHPDVGSPGQPLPSYFAWEPPGLLSYFHRQAHSPAFGSSSNSMLAAPGNFIQPGPKWTCLWLHKAGGWTGLGPSGLWVSSKQTEAAWQQPQLQGNKPRAHGKLPAKRGNREEMLPAARPCAGRCSCAENYPEETIAVTMTMSAARHWQGFLRD